MSYEKLEVTRGLMEAYVGMNAPQAENISEEVEQIDEKTNFAAAGGNAAVQKLMRDNPQMGATAANIEIQRRGAALNQKLQGAAARNTSSGQVQVSSNPIVRTFGGGQEKFTRDAQGNISLNRRFNPRQGTGTNDLEKSITYGGQSYDRLTKDGKVTYVRRGGSTQPSGGDGGGGGGGGGGGSNAPAAPAGTKTAPVASGTVLAKKDGVTGTLDKATGKFTEKGWSDKETLRYQSASTPKPGTKAAGPESIKPKTPNPLMKDMPSGVNSPENEARRGAAALASMASSPNKDKLLGSKIGQQSYDRVLNAPTPKPVPTPAASTSALGSAAKPEVRSALGLKPLNTAQATAATTKPDTGITNQQAAVAATPRPVTANPPAAPKPEDKTKNQPIKEEQDLFDVILEHLLEEGYAETPEAAIKIMTNMGEEWRESIVEAKYGTKAGRKALAKKIRKGKNIGKKGPGTGFKAVEKAAEKGGAEDPAAVAAAQMWKTHGK